MTEHESTVFVAKLSLHGPSSGCVDERRVRVVEGHDVSPSSREDEECRPELADDREVKLADRAKRRLGGCEVQVQSQTSTPKCSEGRERGTLPDLKVLLSVIPFT